MIKKRKRRLNREDVSLIYYALDILESDYDEEQCKTKDDVRTRNSIQRLRRKLYDIYPLKQVASDKA